MTKKYRVTAWVRLVNRVMSGMARRGRGPSWLLTTRGRRTGEDRTVPVSPMSVDGVEYLVSPYGEVSWVHNVRASPEGTLHRGAVVRRCRLVEVTGSASEVVQGYWEREAFARRHMDMPQHPAPEDFSGRASQFPVFRIEPI